MALMKTDWIYRCCLCGWIFKLHLRGEVQEGDLTPVLGVSFLAGQSLWQREENPFFPKVGGRAWPRAVTGPDSTLRESQVAADVRDGGPVVASIDGYRNNSTVTFPITWARIWRDGGAGQPGSLRFSLSRRVLLLPPRISGASSNCCSWPPSVGPGAAQVTSSGSPWQFWGLRMNFSRKSHVQI